MNPEQDRRCRAGTAVRNPRFRRRRRWWDRVVRSRCRSEGVVGIGVNQKRAIQVHALEDTPEDDREPADRECEFRKPGRSVLGLLVQPERRLRDDVGLNGQTAPQFDNIQVALERPSLAPRSSLARSTHCRLSPRRPVSAPWRLFAQSLPRRLSFRVAQWRERAQLLSRLLSLIDDGSERTGWRRSVCADARA